MNYFEKLLEDKCKEEDRQDYQIQWGYDKKLYTSILSAINESYPNYTDHGESHSNSILNNISKIFGDELKKLSSLDIWLLLEASYLHDCGMFISLKKVQEIIKENEFKCFIKMIQHNSKEPLYKYAIQFTLEDDEIKYSNPNYNPQKELAMKYLIAGYKRGSHAFELQETTAKRGDKLLPIRLYKILDLICESHCWNFENIQNLPQKESGLINEIGHPRFISNLLRMGDLLDIDNNRMKYIQTRNLEKEIPLDSKLHLNKHLSITHFRVDSDRIEISALVDCESDTYEVAELTNLWFEYLEKEYANQLHTWKEIVPKNFLGTLPTLGELKVEIKNYEYIDSKNKPKFSVNLEDVAELLIGDSIYEKKEISIRELLQNSIDATYLRVFEEDRKKLDKALTQKEKSDFFKDKKIEIIINRNIEESTNQFNCWNISIKDKGIGIDKETLKYILNTGSSFKNNKKNNIIEKMPNWLKPSGNFGIGFQSIFLLTENVIIKSKCLYTNEDIEIILFKPSEKNRVFIKQRKFDYKKQIGTEISFKYFTSKIGNTYNDDKTFMASYIEDFDPLIDEEFDTDIMNLLDTINEVNEFSLIDIEVKKDGKPINLNKTEFTQDEYDLQDKYELILLKDETIKLGGRSNEIYFKNQLITKRERMGIDILNFKINIVGFKAKEILKINRNNLRGDFYQNHRQDIFKNICFHIYNTYLKENIENINIQILTFYENYKEHFKYFKLELDSEKELSIKTKVFQYKYNENYSINDFLSENSLTFELIKNENQSSKIQYKEHFIEDDEFKFYWKSILKENYYKINLDNNFVKFTKVNDPSEEYVDLEYKNQLKKEIEAENYFLKGLGRFFFHFNGNFSKLKLKNFLDQTKLENWIFPTSYETNNIFKTLYLFRNRNLILCPFFIKRNSVIYNDLIKKRYIEYCFKNRFDNNTTKKEIELELEKLVDHLKKELNLKMQN